jgi:hypothetical protein
MASLSLTPRVILTPRRIIALVATVVAMVSGAPGALARWRPPQRLTWYWQLQGNVDNTHAVAAYDIDGFNNSSDEVAALHAAGRHVICYIDVGTYEPGRPDSGSFPSSVIGSDVQGWPGEKWLDVRQLKVLAPIMTARFQMCARKGFDAVEPDNIDGYTNSPGFPISAQDQLNYDEWVANAVHSLGMAVLQKNDPGQAAAMEPYFDGVLDEQCNEYSECSSFLPYLAAGKPVLNAEYNLHTHQFCSADNSAGIMGALFNLDLDGRTFKPCWGGSSTSSWVSMLSRRLTVSHGRVSVTLGCPRGHGACTGTVTLRSLRQGLPQIGGARFSIPEGRRATISIKLSRLLYGSVAIVATARNRRGAIALRRVKLAA